MRKMRNIPPSTQPMEAPLLDTHPLGAAARLIRSGETGQITARLEHLECKPQVQLRYTAADGRAAEGWFFASEVELI